MFLLSISAVDTTGKDFFLGIPLAPQGISPVFELMIGTPSYQASFTVESATGEISAGTASYCESALVTIDNTFEVTSSGFEDRIKGIRVRATGENPIYVLVTIKYSIFFLSGYAAYLVHPNNEFANIESYEYFALSTDYAGAPAITNRRSNILLIGNQDDTSISLTPTQNVSLPADAQSDGALVEVTEGSTHTLTLGKLQTLLVSSLLDLTGTRIVADKPLTIITGHQCAQVPITSGFCEPLYVQLPPTLNWGQTFLLAPFGGRSADQHYKFVTTKDSTTIAYRCANDVSKGQVISTAGSGLVLPFFPGSYCYLTASNPIFVVQLAPGNRADRMGGPAIAIIPPTTGHVRSASFVNLPFNLYPNNFITVTVQVQHFNVSQIQLDGSRLVCTWNAIMNTVDDEIVGYACNASVTAGTHVVSHSAAAAGVLSVIAYGWNRRPQLGYAYLTNFNLEVSEASTNGSYICSNVSLSI